MSKNKLIDLNDHLFAQLERLGEEGLTQNKELLHAEVIRTESITKVAGKIIDNAAVLLKAKIAIEESISGNSKLPQILEGE